MKNIIGAVGVIFSFLILIGYALYILTSNKFDEPRTAIGEVIAITSGFELVLNYEVKGQTYKTYRSANKGDVIGDIYQIKYELQKPDKCEVINESIMLYKPNQKVGLGHTKGVVETVIFIGEKWLMFNYKVKGVTYTRTQYFDENTYDPNSGERYEVTYIKENPQRAVLNLSMRVG